MIFSFGYGKIQTGGDSMFKDGIKIRKDPPREKYTAEDFIEELEKHIDEIETAAKEDSIEMKRMDVLRNPIFKKYVETHCDPFLPPGKLAGFYRGMNYIASKYLADAKIFLEFLKANPEIAEEIARNTEKPEDTGPKIVPAPLDPDLRPRDMKKH